MIRRYGCRNCTFMIDLDDSRFPNPAIRAMEEHDKMPGDCDRNIHLEAVISKVAYMVGNEQGIGPIDSQVDHPKHFNSHPSGIEAITICRHENFNIGSALKYLLRADHKGNQIQDYNKAVWYICDEIERLGGKIEERT